MDDVNHVAEEIVQSLATGSRRTLARALSIIESTTDTHKAIASKVLSSYTQQHVKSRRIGVTGAPGVGKSTFVEAFGMELVEQGNKVAVLAIDPSSKRSGGSILGDKVRMPRLSMHANAFVRPSPSRTALGGATATTRDAILLCEACGYNTVIIETVGVGQSETHVAQMVDMFLLLVLPNAGDDVQAIKRGIMEVADMIVVNKADIDNQSALRAVAMYQSTLRMILPSAENWISPAIGVSSLTGQGIETVIENVNQYFEDTRSENIVLRRRLQAGDWFDSEIQHYLVQLISTDSSLSTPLNQLRSKVVDGSISASKALELAINTLSISISSQQ